MPVASVGQLTQIELDDFPSVTRPGSGNHSRQTTDVDIALNELVEKAAGVYPTKVVKFLDYTKDENGDDVELKAARVRASARVQNLKGRGYSTDEGWVIRAIDGAVYAKFYGPGNVPDKNKADEASDSFNEGMVGVG